MKWGFKRAQCDTTNRKSLAHNNTQSSHSQLPYQVIVSLVSFGGKHDASRWNVEAAIREPTGPNVGSIKLQGFPWGAHGPLGEPSGLWAPKSPRGNYAKNLRFQENPRSFENMRLVQDTFENVCRTPGQNPCPTKGDPEPD